MSLEARRQRAAGAANARAAREAYIRNPTRQNKVPLVGTSNNTSTVFSHLNAAHRQRMGILPFLTRENQEQFSRVSREARGEVAKFELEDYEPIPAAMSLAA
jgi:hypothetical protein